MVLFLSFLASIVIYAIAALDRPNLVPSTGSAGHLPLGRI